MAVGKFRKRPLEVEALLWTGHNTADMEAFLESPRNGYFAGNCLLRIQTLEGTMTCLPGNWVVKGIRGEYYPCQAGVFDQTYEAVE